MTPAARFFRPGFRRPALGLAAASCVALGGWYAVAQLAPGERGVPPIDSSSNLEVTGVTVDIADRSSEAARSAGWREAQRKAWKILWARAHGMSPDAAPGLPDPTLDSMVSGIEIEHEQIGPHRYIASLGVLFDRGRANGLLGGEGEAVRSSPMLVIPIQYSGGSAQSFEVRTEWQKAWARFRAGASPVDYVRPVGTGADPLLLQLGQSRRPGRLWWRMLLDQYAASDVVTPEVYLERRYPGGPVVARFVARHGPDATVLGGFSLIAANGEALPAILDEGVRRIDAIYVEALGTGGLATDPSLTIEEPAAAPSDDLVPTGDDPLATIVDQPTLSMVALQVETPDSAAVDQVLGALRSITGTMTPTVVSLALGGTSTISMGFAGDLDALKVALAARGWRAEGEGTTLRLRRAAPAPVAPATAPETVPQQ